MQKVFLLSVSVVCLLAGAITLPLPLPTGLILLLIGLALLITNSRTAARWFRKWRERTPWFDVKLRQVEHRLPTALRRALQASEAD